MQKNKNKSITKKSQTWANICVRSETKNIAAKLLLKANNKSFGGRIKVDDLLKIALSN